MINEERLAEICKLFSAEARIRIVKVLKRRGVSVTKLTSQLGITASATSQHLRVLRNAQLVKFLKRGNNIYYSLNEQNIERVYRAFCELFKQGKN